MEPAELQTREQPAGTLFEGQLSRVSTASALGRLIGRALTRAPSVAILVQAQPEPAPTAVPIDDLLTQFFTNAATDTTLDQGHDQGGQTWLTICPATDTSKGAQPLLA